MTDTTRNNITTALLTIATSGLLWLNWSLGMRIREIGDAAYVSQARYEMDQKKADLLSAKDVENLRTDLLRLSSQVSRLDDVRTELLAGFAGLKAELSIFTREFDRTSGGRGKQ